MREIIFRGKSWLDGRWLEGDLSMFTSSTLSPDTLRPLRSCWIGENYRDVRVEETTLGQYTHRDVAGIKIFEGDIVEGDVYGRIPLLGAVHFSEGCWKVNGDLLCNVKNLEILGNIHDHPVLCKPRTFGE